MLTSVLRSLVKNLVKESFYGKKKKKKKKTINVLTVFSFFIKAMSKLSLIRFITSFLRALVSISFFFIIIVTSVSGGEKIEN